MKLDISTTVLIVIISTIILICSIGIIIASIFQRKQRKKYNEVTDLVNKKKNAMFEAKDGLSIDEIRKIDSEVDVNSLMSSLYSTYLEFENRVKNLDSNFDDVLCGQLKDFYINKVESFKNKNFNDITEGIELIGYTITKYSKTNLEFRVTINCFSYRTVDGKIVSGSNLEMLEKIILLNYEKVNDNWLISLYDVIYEKKLGN